MPVARRPVPLSDELLELPRHTILAGKTTLLGRTAAPISDKKPPAITIVSAPTPDNPPIGVPTVAAAKPTAECPAVSTPGSFKHLITPLACNASWCFTPLATPSPSSRFSVFEKMCTNGSMATPGSKAAAVFAKPFPSPNGLFSGGFPVDLQAAPTAPAAGPPATSVAMELVDAQAIAVATSMAHVEARPHLKVSASLWDSVARQDEEEEEDHSDEESEDDRVDIMRRIENAPRPPAGALHPSVGSAGHANGTCKRCCFFPRGRCANGYDCGFCHYEHEKRKRKPKKAARKPQASELGGRGYTSSLAGQLGSLVTPHFAGMSILATPGAPSAMLQSMGPGVPPMMTTYATGPSAYGATATGASAYSSPHMVQTTANAGLAWGHQVMQQQSCLVGPGGMQQLVSLPGGGCCFVQQPQMLVMQTAQDLSSSSQQPLTIQLVEPPPPPAHRAPTTAAASSRRGGGGGARPRVPAHTP